MTMTKNRSAALRQVLLDHKRKRQSEVEGRVREGRPLALSARPP